MTTDPTEEATTRCIATLERSLGDATERAHILAFLARGIEIADEERSDGWYLRATATGVALVTGRLEAFRIRRSNIEFSVIGPVADELRGALDAEHFDREVWNVIPDGIQLRVAGAKSSLALARLEDPFRRFIEATMSRMRRTVSLDLHLPGVVDWVANQVRTDLPQPSDAPPATTAAPGAEAAALQSVAPARRGRASIFDTSNQQLSTLLERIDQGSVALPDLQRRYVWRDTDVRDLLDSLFVGYPVGTLVFWNTGTTLDARALGSTERLRVSTLVIDGQQRLTSLYAAMRDVKVVGKDGDARQITIAFRPRDGRFEVADAAIRNDPEFIPDMRALWTGQTMKSQLRRDFLEALRARGRVIDADYEHVVEDNLDRAEAIRDYRFPVVEIQGARSSEEDVAEVFVRINNQGTRLGQSDFVLTLLAVFHRELRELIETSVAQLSAKSVVPLDTQGLLRTAVALGFQRGRMSAVYRFLRGVDPQSGDTSPAAREQRLQTLDAALKECVDPQTWADFHLRVIHAGFVHPSLIASNNAIVYAYAMYLLGRRACVEKSRLGALISRWLFASLLTARYSGSTETVFEQDLARVAGAANADAFVAGLDQALAEVFTEDYWSTHLVAELVTQRSHAPSALAFRAAQVILGARALFSDQSLRDLFDARVRGTRAASEQHHLFPSAYLQAQGVRDRRRINQVANLADVGWYENAIIGAKAPSRYVPDVRARQRIDDARWGRACAEHALPLGWEAMNYEEFLGERRRRMAELIRAAYRSLGGEAETAPMSPPWFLSGAEHVWKRLGEAERALRGLVRETYEAVYGSDAGHRIRAALPTGAQSALDRALRGRTGSSEVAAVLDHLYLAQLPALLFANDAWSETRRRLGGRDDVRRKLQESVDAIAPVRNEIAHVREVDRTALLRASVACDDLLAMVQASAAR